MYVRPKSTQGWIPIEWISNFLQLYRMWRRLTLSAEYTENHMKYDLSLQLELAENEAEVQRDRGEGVRQMTHKHRERDD